MKLKRYAEKRSLSQKELAILLGISESFLSEYLNEKKSLGANNALRISKITGIKVMDLLFPESAVSE